MPTVLSPQRGEMEKRVLPQNLDAERSILGGLLVHPQSLDDVTPILMPQDFYKRAHQGIYQVILELQNRRESIDIITVFNALSSKKELEKIGGGSVLADIMSEGPTAVHIHQYCKIVKEKSLLRSLIEVSSQILSKAYDETYESVDAFIDEAQSQIFTVGQQRESTNSLVHAVELMKLSIDRLEKLSKGDQEVTGIPSGFNTLDRLTTGFQAGEMIVLAARPSMGKTALSLNMALNAVLRHKKTVAYFSVEMVKEQLMLRLLASEASVNLSDLKVGRVGHWSHLIEKAGHIGESQLFIDDTSGISPQEIGSKARKLKKKEGLDFIIVDYLQIMRLRTRAESREREVAEISRSLKALAKELQIPVLALAQLNRGVEGRSGGDRRPILSDLRESGSIEQDADLIMMLYRDEYYHSDSELKGLGELLIRKHRNGPLGEVKLKWEPNYGRFSSWMDEGPVYLENLGPLQQRDGNHPPLVKSGNHPAPNLPLAPS